MSKPNWELMRKKLVPLTALGVNISKYAADTVNETIVILDQHFATIAPRAPAKSTGRPKKHVNLDLLAKLVAQQKSLRDMGKSLNVSRETIRRAILAGKKSPKTALY